MTAEVWRTTSNPFTPPWLRYFDRKSPDSCVCETQDPAAFFIFNSLSLGKSVRKSKI